MEKPSTKLLKEIQEAYSLPPLSFIEKFEVGYLSHNFVISTGKKKLFLKQHRHQDKNKIDVTFVIEDFFSVHGIPTIVPILAVDGEKLVKIDDRYYSLFPFIRAKRLSRTTVNKSTLVSAATYLAKIHKISKTYNPKLTEEIQKPWSSPKFWKISEQLEKAFSKYRGDKQLLNSARKILALKQEIISANKIKNGDLKLDVPILLHGDYHLNNMFFSKDNKVEYIFDWEKSTLGSRYFELIRALDLICFGTTYNKNRWQRVKLFLKTYHKIFPIKADVFKDELIDFYLKRVHGLWTLEQYFLEDNKRVAPLIPKEFNKINFYRNNLVKLAELAKSVVG